MAAASVAICLATYNPPLPEFERQVESLRTQTHDDWVCIINDDASETDFAAYLDGLALRDQRFQVARNAHNRGFYYNFERCLQRVPEDVRFVALADQDDYWYADKLESLLAAFDKETLLAYSDMRIVDGDGRTLSATYWRHRNNNCTELDELLVANTVTGAASMFRRELLARVLPFPARIGDAFHDHWIACVALSMGKLAYIDRPLYDYYQHGDSVIGHCDFEKRDFPARLKRLASALPKLARPRVLKQRFLHWRNASLAVHQYECLRIESICRSILDRCPIGDAGKRRSLGLYGRGLVSMLRLLVLHVRFALRGATTDDAELRLAAGYLMHTLDPLVLRFHRPRRGASSN